MHKNKLKNLLENYMPTAQEQVYKDRMLGFLQQYDDCFERSLQIGHFTASAFLLNKDGSHALLMHHAKLNIWVQPGGHADGDSDLCAVSVKEAQEESGIESIVPVSFEIFDIDIHRIPARGFEPAHDHYDVRFLLQVTSDESLVPNRESKELRWISRYEKTLPTHEPSVVRMFEKWHRLETSILPLIQDTEKHRFL